MTSPHSRTLLLKLACGVLPLAVASSMSTASGEVELKLKSTPPVWMIPPSNNNGSKFRELFESTPDSWRLTRSKIAGLGYADHWLNSQFTDEELRKWLPQIAKWGLKFGLEVGAVKPWGTTGEKTFGIERKMWDRFIADGGTIDSIAMDEPLAACRDELHLPKEVAIEQTAQFVALVHRNYPKIKIGDIEAYPSFQADELLNFADAVQDRLKQLGVRGLDFFRLDVDWMHFVVKTEAGRFGWAGVRSVETGLRNRRIPFSLIYWAADYPSLKQQGLATDDTWKASILRQEREYASAGGNPDEVVIESWLETPAKSTPESDPATFTNSVLEFWRRFK
jgi:hypothetical protein